MTMTLDGTSGLTTPGVVNTAGETIATTLSVTGATNLAVSSGNVGIGTASPTSKLHIRPGTDSNLEVQVSTVTTGVQLLSINSARNAYGPIELSGSQNVFYTNGTEAMRIDTAGLLKFNSGYGSAATAYGCRAWVNFNGTGTVAIRASGNVSSITDNAAGDYTVNFTTAMVDANYNVCGSVNGVGGNPLDEMVFAPKVGGTFSTAAVQIFTINPVSAGGGDSTYVSCSIFR